MPVPHGIAAETELWDTYAESTFKDDAEPSFCWTQYAGYGPGPSSSATRARCWSSAAEPAVPSPTWPSGA